MTTVFPGFNSSKIQVRAGPTARTRTDVELSAEPIPAIFVFDSKPMLWRASNDQLASKATLRFAGASKRAPARGGLQPLGLGISQASSS